jgi:iron-sulfur cluster insertion protein
MSESITSTENQASQTDSLIPITIDQSALEQTQTLAALEEHKDSPCLRVYLEGKGCDGFTYGVAFDKKTEKDYVFPQSHGGYSIELICDPDSYMFVKGSTITFVNDMRGAGYVVENPRHKRFRGKFYKKKVWQDRLLEKRDQMEQSVSN